MPPVAEETRSWWGSLRHGGLLIAPSRLTEFFPTEAPPIPAYLEERLRRDLIRFETRQHNADIALLDTVLEQVIGLGRSAEPSSGYWLKAGDVPSEWTRRAISGEVVKPRRVWNGAHGATLPVFFDDSPHLGIGRGRRPAARVVEWLRQAGHKVAVLTNGQQWRIVYAGLDHDAFAEADAKLWFEEGAAGPQVTALRTLLAQASLTPAAPSEPSPLFAAIDATRRGQAELSQVLGERVRLAVELLIREHGQQLSSLLQADKEISPRHIYLAAVRMVMRMVVVLFAEARPGLLPVENPVYFGSYGLSGLREQLDRAGGATGRERLRHRYSAWPRVLGLFRLIHRGSSHSGLAVPAYGGGLFEAGDAQSPDPVLRTIRAFENGCFSSEQPVMPDASVQRMLELLTRCPMRVRMGRGAAIVDSPVDFSDLSSEYIGILYEGLLDFELRRAPEGDPVLFLRLGDEPALPLSRLEAMDDETLASLVEKAKTKRKVAAAEDEEDAGDEEEPLGEDAEDAEAGGGPPPASEAEAAQPEAEPDGPGEAAHNRSLAWARRAVLAGGLVPRPRSKKPDALREQEDAVARTAANLVRVVLPGEWFLVRFGGTRKGAGTFYTRPQLAVPTVQRTLRPLAYEPPADANGQPDLDAPAERWTPKQPDQVLALKVCDPACGSGSFLVAVLRFLAEGLKKSLFHHRWIEVRDEGLRPMLAEDAMPPWLADCLRDVPATSEDAEGHLEALLKRVVVERCLYGVDLDPLAVELARLSLWVETMERRLPFSFLDHKVKCGNSLVGCWFDHFRDYPALAWCREGGDKEHTRGTHFKAEAWTRAIKEKRNGVVKSGLREWIVRSAGQEAFAFEQQGASAESLHEQSLLLMEGIHALPVHEAEERARLYRERFAADPALARLREAFDTWCALWFWPADGLDDAPLPGDIAAPREASRALAAEIARKQRFFHWELEFPEVFARAGAGFDAIVGNPPWEIQKPASKEFFSNLDPLYRAYGKQHALDRQAEMFAASAKDERDWLLYCAGFKGLANFAQAAAYPFGDGTDGGTVFALGQGSRDLHQAWASRRARRQGYADPAHPFRWQGSADLNTYKMFLEAGHALLCSGGRMGFIVPSGLYTDKGTTDLRNLFLTRCSWEWLFGFENRDGIFPDVDGRFKFCPVIVEKGGETTAVRTAFMRRRLADWEEAEKHAIPYSRAQVDRFSPRTLAILEIRERRDLEVLEKIYANSVLLGDGSEDGWRIQYAREFDMTNDSKLFPPRPKWEAQGFRPDEYGRWLKFSKSSPDLARARDPGWIKLADGSAVVWEGDIEDVALPLYEGRMIGQFDFSQKGWVSGKGRGAVWRDVPWDTKRIESQYLMARSSYLDAAARPIGTKVAHMRIGSATNERSSGAAVLEGVPTGDTAAIFWTESSTADTVLCALLNSFAFDSVMRVRLGGLHLDYHVFEQNPLPSLRSTLNHSTIADHAAALALPSVCWAAIWIATVSARRRRTSAWRQLWAITDHERLRLRCLLDAIVAELYGLDWNDLAWILRDCDHPADRVGDRAFARTLDPKGFWRVDKEKVPELRHSVLSLVAFHDLKETIAANGNDRDRGIEAFCAQNEGDGWMLPEAVRLADYGLGHDDRAKEPQPVAARLGERFLPWQLEQSVEESWAECERHARNVLGEAGYTRLKDQIARGDDKPALPLAAEPSAPPYDERAGTQRRLFPGEPTLFGEAMEDPPATGRRSRPGRGKR